MTGKEKDPSLCDKCYAPGSCCKDFALFTGGGERRTFWDEGSELTLEYFMSKPDFPFLPIPGSRKQYTAEDGKTFSGYRFMCPKLQHDGRCGIYESRPEVCRSFEAGSDSLCVHYLGAEGVDLVEGL